MDIGGLTWDASRFDMDAHRYSPEEIFAKSVSLKGVMEPFSTQGNIDLLKRAGFVGITSVIKNVCFEGFLTIK